MPERIRFGPAGKPVDLKGGDYVKAVEYVASEGLDALEYQAVRGVKITQSKAYELRLTAERCGVLLSLHAPYFINLSSTDKDVLEKSKDRLKAAVEAASWMGAYVVVFHPGYYKGNPSKEHAVRKVIDALKEVAEWMVQHNIKGVTLSPETTGKTSQVGDLDEVVRMCQEVELCKPTIDWAHLYARYRGHFITSIDDVVKVVDKLEKELGSRAVKPLHTHFTRVEYGEGGEKEHHALAETQYGPEFEHVCRAFKELGVQAVVISESPLLDKDATVMKHICCDRYCYC